ncbi:hypothetical protein Ancab_031711 [Ancistrocladus abbreviatus]
MEMEDQYAMPADLRHFINTTTATATNIRPASQFPTIPSPQPLPPPDFFSTNHRLVPPPQSYPFEMLVMGRHVTDILPHGSGGSGVGVSLHDHFHSDSTITTTTTTATNNTTIAATNSGGGTNMNFSVFEPEVGGGGVCLDGGTARWPRQETLTLLEIRSRLDHKFKEANQKGPLWDEVSRIMYEEHGYQRSGKKCREKFENLYKYYKKTKEGKAGRQDGKHYRFFRQLEALYGESSNATASASDAHIVGNINGSSSNALRFHHNAMTSNQEAKYHHSMGLASADSLSSFSNSTDFDTSSSDDLHDEIYEVGGSMDNESKKKKTRNGKRSWKAKIKEFIDNQMRKLMEKQEAWLDKMTRTLEHKEQERMIKEEEWRKHEAERMEKEHEFWAKERAWIEARDAALMEALQKLTGHRVMSSSNAHHHHSGCDDQRVEDENMDRWSDSEVSRLFNLRTSMESSFQQCGPCSGDQIHDLWEDIASRMASLGYDRSAMMYKGKWDSITNSLMKAKKECNKKRKENWRGFHNNNGNNLYNQGGGNGYGEVNEQGAVVATETSTPSHCSVNVNAMNDSCFRFLIGEGETMWENQGVKMDKGET